MYYFKAWIKHKPGEQLHSMILYKRIHMIIFSKMKIHESDYFKK